MSNTGSIEEIVLENGDVATTRAVAPQQPQQSIGEFTVTPIENNEIWIKKTWRPAIAWQYIAVCLFDFIAAPILTMILFHGEGVDHYVQWTPITLQGGGLYHAAMGAITGVYAWSRGQEKIRGIEI